MSQQGLRQASIRAVTGSAETYEGDWHRLFDLASIPAGQFDERLLRWINYKLGVSYTALADAMQGFAVANGATNFSAMGTFSAGSALPPADATDWATFATAFNAKRAAGGGTIYLAAGTYVGANTRVMAAAPASPAFTATGAKVIVRAQDPLNPPSFGATSAGSFTCNVADVEFYGIDFTLSSLWPSQACVNQTTTAAARQAFSYCIFSGPAFDLNDTTNWRCEGAVDSGTGTYGVAGTLILDITGGSSPVTVNVQAGDTTVTAVVNRINAAISSAGQYGQLEAVKLSSPTAIRINRLDQTVPNMAGKTISISGTLVTTLGFGSAGAKTVTVRPIPTYALLLSASQAVNGISIQHCTIKYLREGYKPPNSTGGYFLIDYNDMWGIGGDYVQISPYDVNPPVNNSISFNRMYAPVALESDTGDHLDSIQFTAAGASKTTVFSGCDITGNIITDLFGRGGFQFTFISDQDPTGWWLGLQFKGNLMMAKGGNSQMPAIDHIVGGYLFANISTTSVPGAVVPTKPNFLPSGVTGQETNYVGSNLVCLINADPNCQYENNTVLGNYGGALLTYVPTASASGTYSDINDLASKIVRTDGAAGYVNYVSRTIDIAKEPGVVNFPALTGQTPGASIYSAWSLIKGGGPGQPWTVSGGVVQFADDSSGTGNTGDLTGSGTVNAGKYARLGFTMPATGSTNKSATLTLQNGRVNTFTARTANILNFSTANNQGSAYSGMASAPVSASPFNRFIFAARFRQTALPSVYPGYVFGRSSVTTHLSIQTGPKYRMQLLGSGNRVDWGVPDTGVWHTVLVSWDLSRPDTDPNNLVKVVMDGARQTPSSVGCDLTGTVAYNQNTAIGLLQAFGLSGANFMNGDIAFIWADWGNYSGGSGYSLIDITDPAVINMFEPDWINLTNGSGPTGGQPKIFYMSDATGWNAGYSNKGSLAIAMNKTAGTYV